MKRGEVDTTYDGYCPLGEVCSKGGSKLCTKNNFSDCKGFVMHHLMRPPYYLLAAPMAEDALLADSGAIEAWVRTVQHRVVTEYDEAGQMLSKTYEDGTMVMGKKRKATKQELDEQPLTPPAVDRILPTKT